MPIWDRIPGESPEDRYEREISAKLVTALWEGDPEIKIRVKSRHILLDLVDDLRNVDDGEVAKAVDVIVYGSANHPDRPNSLKVLASWVKKNVIDINPDRPLLPPSEK